MANIDPIDAADALAKIEALATAAGYLDTNKEQLSLMLGILDVISQKAAAGQKKNVA